MANNQDHYNLSKHMFGHNQDFFYFNFFIHMSNRIKTWHLIFKRSHCDIVMFFKKYSAPYSVP